MSRRALTVLAVAACVAFMAILSRYARPSFPDDRVPEGAYARIALGVANDDPRSFFAYLETEAQWACFTIGDARRRAYDLVSKSYPEPQRSELRWQYESLANAKDGSDVFAVLYAQRGWSKRLRKDLSGTSRVEVEGDRASVVTARGTRWPFRKRDNGIWGLTIFTAELTAESEKATRDLAVVTKAAADYDRAGRGLTIP